MFGIICTEPEVLLTLLLDCIFYVKCPLESSKTFYLPPFSGVQETADCHTEQEMFPALQLTKADSKTTMEACLVNCVLLNLKTFGCQRSTNAS